MSFHALQSALLSAAGAGFEALSWESAQRVGERLGLLAGTLARGRDELALRNLRASFPEAPEAQLLEWRRQAWRNLGRVGAEILWARRRTAEEVAALVEVEGLDRLDAAMRDGGALVHLGHFANWELAGLAMAARGRPLAVVARRIRNPYIHETMTQARERLGTRVILHKNPFFGCVRSLKENRAVGILMDQNMPKGDLFLPFFGRPAATSPLTALLAHRTGRPILPMRIWREGPKIRVAFEEAVPLGPTPEATTAALNAILERWIRARPGDWFWVHNRWKRKPPTLAPLSP